MPFPVPTPLRPPCRCLKRVKGEEGKEVMSGGDGWDVYQESRSKEEKRGEKEKSVAAGGDKRGAETSPISNA